jgi:putative two-component system response regulator
MATTLSMPGARILVVDDNAFITSLLCQGLTAEGYDVTATNDGLHALDLISSSMPDLIFLDIEMPGLTGDEVCRRLKSHPATRFIPVVMISGLDAFPNKIAAWDYGADDFLTKPFHMVEVVARCRSLLRIKRLLEERDSAEAVVFALARAVEAKSLFTAGHSERVTQLALTLAADLGVPDEQREVLARGSLLHDIGKISIPDAILDKPGKLTAQEYAVVQQHPATGAHILEPLSTMRDLIPLIRWHHERLDGKGYPDRLGGDEIPLLVRILSICDVYDSLASERPYRHALPQAECLAIMRDDAAGGGLEGDLVACFERFGIASARIASSSPVPLDPRIMLDAEHSPHLAMGR